ncbi:Protein CHUP1, chloroplastic [Morella rubra]|uniref:Protein CHUP1, chloroplastic n=1 Tax=Morella rubra TaxID=262757 RepID=A0A6A1W1Z9_9ROSI|nr:Protein CHUP1, chloroplastic [Morella rubra]
MVPFQGNYYHWNGFFTDSYDLFSISIATKLLGRLYYTEPSDPKPGTLPLKVYSVYGLPLCGTLAGQLFFGCLGDKLGRKKVDETAVLKHFDWPEQKADALREAAFAYCDLKKLKSEATSFRDSARQPYVPALKKMQALLEKLEHGVYNLSRLRESATRRYKDFHIPTDWMLDTGYVSQTYIDFEISEGEFGRTIELYERLLDRTKHLKVWISYAKFEVSAMEDNGDLD